MTSIRTALISVSDKRGVIDLARALVERGVTILSTGGTARSLRGADVPVTDVSEYTGSPEVMDGRVKTLHPRVHGGILMRDTIGDRTQLTELGGAAIDLVVVNLYPFQQTVARDAAHEEIIENIDIGGPSMIRSAAKNHARVTVVVDPDDYDTVIAELEPGPSLALRARLAAKAFSHTAAYDGAIAQYLTSRKEDGGKLDFPGTLALTFEKVYDLRYGENPHQKGAFYAELDAPAGSLARAEALGAGGKELSFNNLVDVEAALDAVREHDAPAAVVVKHTNPCGVATGDTLASAYRLARDADALSAFGGIVALNREVDLATAALLGETFLECVVAPGYSAAARDLLAGKKNLRLVAASGDWKAPTGELAWSVRTIAGGALVQSVDNGMVELANAKVATTRTPTDAERADLGFAWRVAKHVKSNAIVFAKDGVTVAIGAGQMSRVDSVRICERKAGAALKGAVVASDAFFPFRDGVDVLAEAGAVAVVQPGGSVRDDEVIGAANEHGLAMLFTGMRHFRH